MAKAAIGEDFAGNMAFIIELLSQNLSSHGICPIRLPQYGLVNQKVPFVVLEVDKKNEKENIPLRNT
jgi:hypothetical protein